MTPDQCADMFTLLDAAYPKERMTEPQMALYTMTLAPYDVGQVRDAVMLHIHTSPWFPRISDIIDKLTKREQLDAAAAWGEVVQKIRSVGMYRVPEWSHHAVGAAVRAMGWAELCLSDNPEADRAHFMRFYEVTTSRAKEEQIIARMDALNPGMREALKLIGKSVSAMPTRAVGEKRRDDG